MKLRTGWAVLWALGMGWAQATPTLTVRVLEKRAPALVQLREDESGDWTGIKLTRANLSVNGKALSSYRTKAHLTVHLKADGLDRRYPGTLTLSPAPDGKSLKIIDELSLDEYVACVTASESGYDKSQPEYLKALGAVIREYALGHLKRHPQYDLCDLAHCQVFQGIPKDFPFWEKIANATQAYNPGIGPNGFYFHHCCGGVLGSAQKVWGGPETPGSRTGPDEVDGEVLCQGDPKFTWRTETQVQKVETTLKNGAGLPENARLMDFQVVEKEGPRNKTFLGSFRLSNGKTRQVRINAQKFVSEFGKKFGWRVFPSLWFGITPSGDNLLFSGRGFGHGVGLCQAGAVRLAQKGWKWKDILGFYFPGPRSIGGTNISPNTGR
jgi:stage II sporulation protein D